MNYVKFTYIGLKYFTSVRLHSNIVSTQYLKCTNAIDFYEVYAAYLMYSATEILPLYIL